MGFLPNFQDQLCPNGGYARAETFFIFNYICFTPSDQFLKKFLEERIFFIIANFLPDFGPFWESFFNQADPKMTPT